MTRLIGWPGFDLLVALMPMFWNSPADYELRLGWPLVCSALSASVLLAKVIARRLTRFDDDFHELSG